MDYFQTPFACSACTYVNEEGGEQCEICDTPRPATEQLAEPEAKTTTLARCTHEPSIPCERKSIFCSRTGDLNILKALTKDRATARAIEQYQLQNLSRSAISISDVAKITVHLGGYELKDTESQSAKYVDGKFVELIATKREAMPSVSANDGSVIVMLPLKDAIIDQLKSSTSARRPLVMMMNADRAIAYLIIFPSGYSYLVDPSMSVPFIAVVEAAIGSHFNGLRTDGMLNSVRHVPQSAWNRTNLSAVGKRPIEQHNMIGLMALALIVECKMSPIDAIRHIRGLLASEMNSALGQLGETLVRESPWPN